MTSFLTEDKFVVPVGDYAQFELDPSGQLLIRNAATNGFDGRGDGDLRALRRAFDRVTETAQYLGFSELWCDVALDVPRAVTRLAVYRRAGFEVSEVADQRARMRYELAL